MFQVLEWPNDEVVAEYFDKDKARSYEEHESIAAAKAAKSERIDLRACFELFTTEETLVRSLCVCKLLVVVLVCQRRFVGARKRVTGRIGDTSADTSTPGVVAMKRTHLLSLPPPPCPSH